MPALSKKDSTKENLCLENRCPVLEQNVPDAKFKIPTPRLHNDGGKIAMEDPVNKSWLRFLNVLLDIARSLVNFDRRMKFVNAKLLSD